MFSFFSYFNASLNIFSEQIWEELFEAHLLKLRPLCLAAEAQSQESQTFLKALVFFRERDNDNFDNDETERSHVISLKGLSDWRATNEFPTLSFLGEF